MKNVHRPLISVIMGVHNPKDRNVLYSAVQSVLDQSYDNFEFIIWNDGSDADTVCFLNDLPKMDDRIFLAGLNVNRGLAFSLNECIRLAKGKYIARMDADDFSLPDRLAEQVAFLEEHPEYSWCGCAAELFDEEGIWGFRRMPLEPKPTDYYRYSPYIHPSVMFRAEVFDETKGYLETEETLRCEDYEIFMRLTQRGLKGYNLQDALFCYRENRESYAKRKMCYRINEMKMRFYGYKQMGIIFPFGWIYALRPVAAGLFPPALLGMLKRKEGAAFLRMRDSEEKDCERQGRVHGTYEVLSKVPEGNSCLTYGVRAC